MNGPLIPMKGFSEALSKLDKWTEYAQNQRDQLRQYTAQFGGVDKCDKKLFTEKINIKGYFKGDFFMGHLLRVMAVIQYIGVEG